MNWKIALAIALLTITGLKAEWSYMDLDQIGINNFLNLNSHLDSIFATQHHPFSSRNQCINSAINLAPHSLLIWSQKSKNEVTKKRLEKAIKYTSWYNSESRGWRHIDLNFGATPKDIGTSLFNQIGKPALFLAFDEGMSNIERPNILQYIPEEYREEVVDQGKFIIASTGVELLDIVTQGNSASMSKKWDRLCKNTQFYAASKVTEQGINFITNYTMGSEPSTNKSAVRVVASLFALAAINRAIKGKPNAANPACY